MPCEVMVWRVRKVTVEGAQRFFLAQRIERSNRLRTILNNV